MTRIKIWDLAIRIFHWSLVVAFVMSGHSAFQDKVMTGYDKMHLNAGLAILILATSRLIWGFVGSSSALFTSFVRGPRKVIAHIRTIRGSMSYDHIGHNPLGGWFVVTIIIALIVQATMGLYSSDDILFEGPLAASVGEQLSSQITGYHKTLGMTLMVLAGLHVASVILYSFGKGVNLIKPMITGYKVVSDDLLANKDISQTLAQRSPLWALILFLGVGYICCAIIF